jgi:hypothetical protein
MIINTRTTRRFKLVCMKRKRRNNQPGSLIVNMEVTVSIEAHHERREPSPQGDVDHLRPSGTRESSCIVSVARQDDGAHKVRDLAA